MKEEFSRTKLIFGEEGMRKLAGARVAVFGLGGVGGHVVEALARSGVGAIDVIDSDRVSVSNINRQVLALQSTVGMYKTDAAKARIADINPDCKVTAHTVFFMPETAGDIDFSQFDYVVDAIDTVTGKLAITECAKRAGVPVISCMGAGNKLDPTAFKVTDIYKTSVCPLAKVMRRELKRRGIDSLKVVYSEETPVECESISEGTRRAVPASVAFVPSVAGLIAAGEVIKDLVRQARQENN